MLSFFLRPRLGTSDSLEINCLQEIYHSGFTFLMLVVWAILGKNVISIPAHTQENKISHIFDLFVKTAFFQYCQILLKIMNKPKDNNNEKVATVYRQQVFLAKYSEMYPCLKPFSFRNSFGKMVTDEHKAYCTVCHVGFKIQNSGLGDCKRHVGSKGHANNLKKQKGTNTLSSLMVNNSQVPVLIYIF